MGVSSGALSFILLAGPDAITSVILLYDTSGLILTILSIVIIVGITYLILLFINSFTGLGVSMSNRSIRSFYSNNCRAMCSRMLKDFT